MKVLIVDDSVDFSTTLADIIRSFNIDAACVNSPKEAISYMERNHSMINLILLDIEFGFGEKMNGLDLLGIFRQKYFSIPVVMISGKGTIETAVRATKLGATNFIEKNIITKEKIRGIIDSTINQTDSFSDTVAVQNFLSANEIIGKSKAITELGKNIIKYGRTDLNILITGETGTGKKLVAKAIHSISKRKRAEFVTVDIPNIPKEAFQSELFGHIQGAFSSVSKTTVNRTVSDSKKGLFHQAAHGTLFFVQIADLSSDLQSYLLNPIEEKTIRPVGAIENESVDIRFISATDKDLLDMMRTGKFREQLYHRLRECEINVPPLASRQEDIPEIINHFLRHHNLKFMSAKFFAPSAIDYLMEQKWLGNVRELSSSVRMILQTTDKNEIDVSDIIKTLTSSAAQKAKLEQIRSIPLEKTLREDLKEVDRIKIEQALLQNNGNVSKTAAILGISRETLHNKIKKYEINVQMFRNRSHSG